MNYSVCLLAAGKGNRTQLEYNKVFYKLENGKTVLDMSLSIFLQDVDCKQIILVCASHELEQMKAMYSQYPKVGFVVGGSTRQESVENGLDYVQYPYVFIHDAARPYVQREQIDALKKTLAIEKACLLMVPSIDTVKVVENGYVKTSLERSLLYNAQTPQCFETELIKTCYKKAREEQKQATDDAQLVEWYSDVPVKVVLGDASNKKITVPSDLVA